ncbi:cytochrome-c peroxidase [Aquimarina sp. D1M17]|uniref:cytochrome-c peroxidase n=1 Tax=Aquimarina acroporae TaxID=2937283 RepID=UPI0020BDF4BE|nr:cytochrome c peroxidase [Aquimarina acroporae]MCK8523636.1 cytochrome-c peroxidase [Aquimarina acroporae]
MKKITIMLMALAILTSCSDDDYVEITQLDRDLLNLLNETSDGVGVSFYTLPSSDDYARIPQDPLNPITKEKVELGKLLIHETAFGTNPKMKDLKGTYSCTSCHQVAAGFSSGLRQGIGECGVGFGFNGNGRIIKKDVPLDSVDIQPLRSPTILNVAYQDVMLWNGQFGGTGTNAGTEANWTNIQENFLGFQGVEVQAIKGQGVHRLAIDEDFVNNHNYKELFDKAFGNVAENERYSTINAALAMAAYERVLLPNEAPWQEWLKGDFYAMSDTEKRGAIAFFGKGKCFECHTGPALNDKGFHAFGMGDFDDSETAVVLDDAGFDGVKKGRGGFTKNPDDNYKFKTPTLYNIVDNGFYGHGGTFTSVKEVVAYKNNGVPQSTEVPSENLASQFGTTNLTEQEINDITAFIESGLRDPNLQRYVPEQVNSGFCFPNNDAQSQSDLGCN